MNLSPKQTKAKISHIVDYNLGILGDLRSDEYVKELRELHTHFESITGHRVYQVDGDKLDRLEADFWLLGLGEKSRAGGEG